jgi:hypothetical protein
LGVCIGGGVTWSTANSPSLVTTMITGAAHHLELRHSNPLDPQSVVDARNLNRQWITRWIEEAQDNNDNGRTLSDIALVAIAASVATVVVALACYCFNRRSGTSGQLQNYQGMPTS